MSDVHADAGAPDRLEALLRERGWNEAAVVEGRYKRFLPQGEKNTAHSLIVPTNPEMKDFTELFEEAIREAISRFSVAKSASDFNDLLAAQVIDDVVRFAKESSLPGGHISWAAGEQLISATRQSLTAGAKATAEKAAYFGHKHSGFASRYLDTVRMGQTEVGSFIVTAHTRSNTTITAHQAAKGRPAVVLTAGDVSATLATAFSSVRSIIDESRGRKARVENFADAIPDGVSTDLLKALVIATESAGAVSTAVSRVGATPGAKPIVVAFESEDRDVLDRGARFLSSVSPKREVSITGWVKVVTRPTIGQAGVINLVVQSGSLASQVKVRLSEAQFAIASQAIVEERYLKVLGTQEREGSTYWLYEPTVEIAEKLTP